MRYFAPNTISDKSDVEGLLLSTTIYSHSKDLAAQLISLTKKIVQTNIKIVGRQTKSKLIVRGYLLSNDGSDKAAKFGFHNMLGIYDPSKNHFIVFNFEIVNGKIHFTSLSTLIHEISHQIQFQLISDLVSAPQPIIEGLAELAHYYLLYDTYGVIVHYSKWLNYDYSTYDPKVRLYNTPTSPLEKDRDLYSLSTIFLFWLYTCENTAFYKVIYNYNPNELDRVKYPNFLKFIDNIHSRFSEITTTVNLNTIEYSTELNTLLTKQIRSPVCLILG